MTKVLSIQEIKQIVASISIDTLIQRQEEGFKAYSQGNVTVPPVGYLGFDDPRGDVHIKYGYIKGDNYYVIKEATTFFENGHLYNIPTGNGFMIVCNAKTGQVEGILLDEGYLTDVRTGLAGAVVAKLFAPRNISNIGIVGTGSQARFQLRYLKEVLPTKNVYVWGRDVQKAKEYKRDMEQEGFSVSVTTDMKVLCDNCNYIVTTTPAKEYILFADQVHPGTHITDMGIDAKGKQELDPQIFQKATFIVVDSISQCVDHGAVSYAIEKGILSKDNIHELGKAIGEDFDRKEDDITVVDLTGVACQDIQIAKLVYLASQSII